MDEQIPTKIIPHVISTWSNVFRTLVLLSGIMLVFWVCVFITLQSLQSHKVKIVTGETTVMIGNDRLDSILVHPRGWVDTGIYIKKGDKVTARATGSVNLAAGRLVSKLNTICQAKPEEIINNTNKAILGGNQNFYLREKYLLDFSWLGPNGDSGTLSPYLRNNPIVFAKKKKRFLDPRGNHGALVFLIRQDGVLPKLSEKLDNTSQLLTYQTNPTTFIAKVEGKLYVAVNDEVFIGNDYLTQITWQDNLGHFAVNFAITN